MCGYGKISVTLSISACAEAQEAIKVNSGCLLSGQLSSVICFSSSSTRDPKMLHFPKKSLQAQASLAFPNICSSYLGMEFKPADLFHLSNAYLEHVIPFASQ